MYIYKLPWWLSSKESTFKAGDTEDVGFDPWVWKIPGGGCLQYCCWENPMDRGARQATVQWVTKSWTQLKRLSSRARARAHTHTHTHVFIIASFNLLFEGYDFQWHNCNGALKVLRQTNIKWVLPISAPTRKSRGEFLSNIVKNKNLI